MFRHSLEGYGTTGWIETQSGSILDCLRHVDREGRRHKKGAASYRFSL